MARYRSRSRSYSPRRRSRTPPRGRKRYVDDRHADSRSHRDRRSPLPSGLLVRNLPLDARFACYHSSMSKSSNFFLSFAFLISIYHSLYLSVYFKWFLRKHLNANAKIQLEREKIFYLLRVNVRHSSVWCIGLCLIFLLCDAMFLSIQFNCEWKRI